MNRKSFEVLIFVPKSGAWQRLGQPAAYGPGHVSDGEKEVGREEKNLMRQCFRPMKQNQIKSVSRKAAKDAKKILTLGFKPK